MLHHSFMDSIVWKEGKEQLIQSSRLARTAAKKMHLEWDVCLHVIRELGVSSRGE